MNGISGMHQLFLGEGVTHDGAFNSIQTLPEAFCSE